MNIHLLTNTNANSDIHLTSPPLTGQQRHRQSTYFAVREFCCDESFLSWNCV